ncbi:MAG: tetratricopeptide repeat protein [Xanthomonadales bacterium]|nr:tetratricopeptide repeat protein [Xanthomonadales bacterium]
MRYILTWLLLSWLVLTCPLLLAKADDDEVDFIELASVLVQDSHYDRAEDALQNVDLTAEAVNVGKYHTVYGLIHLNRGESALAKKSFYAAIDAGFVDEITGQTPDVLYIYLAQVHFALEEYREAIDSILRAGETAARLSSTYIMRAHAHWLLNEKDQTWTVLEEASERFPGNYAFTRRKVFYLIDLGLFQEAADLGKAYLEAAEGEVDDFVAIGNALRQAGEYDEALGFLEQARLRFPDNEDAAKVLAHTYLARGDLLAAAEIFYKASAINPDLVSEAAELYRRAGKPYRALILNAQIEKQDIKLKQRLAILLELERFSQITAMEEALTRSGLLAAEEDLRYALAYAYFKVGRFDEVERHLPLLKRPDLFRKGIELRRVMEDCLETPWRCS